MHLPVATKDPAAVQAEVQKAFQKCFPKGDPAFVPRAFRWAEDCFFGRYQGYQAIDAPYHDLEHSLQGTLCMARLLSGRHQAGVEPRLSEHYFQLGILAILLHDTGYLKKRGDTEGTGAKYTLTHVARSAEFSADFLSRNHFVPADIRAVQHMISCTGVDSELANIPFQNEMERVAGHALGTADLLGQMAAADYVDKLPALYQEFTEAAKFSHDDKSFVSMYSSVEDLTERTEEFWRHYVQPKLEKDFGNLHLFLNDPYPDGRNFYLEQIEANIQRLRH